MSDSLHQAQSHDILRSWQSQRNDVNHHKDFVLPMFIGNNDDSIEAIENMPDVYRYGTKRAVEYLEPLVYSFGLRAVLLFPVITKSDQRKLEVERKANELEVDRYIGSSSDSSTQPSSSPSSASSSSNSDDDGERRRGTGGVLPERLLPVDDTTPGGLSNSQNPFLSQNEEEEDHLLSHEQNARGEESSLAIGALPVEASEQMGSRQTARLDIRLIKGMALKDKYNPVLRLIPMLRAKFPHLLIICDVCLCAFTSTGHCCLFDDEDSASGQVSGRTSGLDYSTGHHSFPSQLPRPHTNNPMSHFPMANKITCQYLALLSVEYALRGCNVVAPSDMMDGRILTIRERLNENRLHHVAIMSYSAKFASAFYGPFRSATNNAPEFGDRRAYQLPPGSRTMSMKAVRRDILQGADFLMVKPASPYLDIVRDIREAHPDVPIAVYQVSGEYALLKLAAKHNVVDLKLAVNEMLTSFRRAGANIIITYFTPEILRGEL